MYKGHLDEFWSQLFPPKYSDCIFYLLRSQLPLLSKGQMEHTTTQVMPGFDDYSGLYAFSVLVERVQEGMRCLQGKVMG